jgi:drug/metabolite transporter (DMT)-like permease
MWIVLAIISALFSAAAAIGEKKTLQNISALNFSLLLSLANTILSLPFLYLADLATVTVLAVVILFVKSMLGAVSFLFVMKGLKSLDISGSLPLLVLTPGLTALLAFFFLNETLSTFELSGMLILLIGTYILQLKPKASYLDPFKISQQPKALLYILLAVVIFSITSVVDKSLLSHYKLSPYVFIPLQHIFYSFLFAVLFFLKRSNKANLKSSYSEVWKLILIVAVFTIVYRFSHIFALKLGSVALVLSIKRTSVFFASIIGGTYFKEQNLWRKAFATLLLILGALLIINS